MRTRSKAAAGALALAGLDVTASGGSGAGGSGTAKVLNFPTFAEYTANNRTGYFTAVFTGNAIGDEVDRTSNVSINRRNTKPYNCTTVNTPSFNVWGGLLTFTTPSPV